MKPEITRIIQISPDQSVACIIGKDEIPGFLKLSKSETEYALKQIKAKEEYVIINSYFKNTYIIRTNTSGNNFKILEELRKTAFNLRKQIRSNNHPELVITSYQAPEGSVEALTEGLTLSFYSFDKYKTKKEAGEKKNYPSKLLVYGDTDDVNIKWLINLTDAVYLTRDLINEPVNHLNAVALAEEIKKMGNTAGFQVEVLNKGKIEALKMGGLLAVNKGSIDPPVFCILEWKPEKPLNANPLVLIGKGIVYDTGGLNIKTGVYMDNMKADMAGAAAITGVLYTTAKANLPLHVIGLVPATDNRPGGNAYTQGDIITMYNKMTVEVGNTDAEGRCNQLCIQI
jgi:leucyl aminopeptidase